MTMLQPQSGPGARGPRETEQGSREEGCGPQGGDGAALLSHMHLLWVCEKPGFTLTCLSLDSYENFKNNPALH